MKRVVGYIRVSTGKQANKGHSLEAQKDEITRYAERKGYVVEKWFVDAAKTRGNLMRNAYIKMHEGIKNGIFNHVIIFKRDRLIGSVDDFTEIYKTLVTSLNCTIETIHGDILSIDTVDEWFKEIIQTVIDQREVLLVSERTRKITKAATMAGKYVYGGKLPFGFIRNKEKKLEHNQEEKEIILYIYQQLLNGKSKLFVYSNLMKEYPSIKWTRKKIKTIVSNTLNYGVLTAGTFTVENFVEPIISYSDWLSANKNYDRRTYKTGKYILKNKVICDKCNIVVHNTYTIKKTEINIITIIVLVVIKE